MPHTFSPEIEAMLSKLNPDEQDAFREQLAADLAAARRSTESVGSLAGVKVSKKGAVSIYGFGQWPLTAYPSNMLKLLNNADMLRQWIAEHANELNWKKDAPLGEGAPSEEEILGL